VYQNQSQTKNLKVQTLVWPVAQPALGQSLEYFEPRVAGARAQVLALEPVVESEARLN